MQIRTVWAVCALLTIGCGGGASYSTRTTPEPANLANNDFEPYLRGEKAEAIAKVEVYDGAGARHRVNYLSVGVGMFWIKDGAYYAAVLEEKGTISARTNSMYVRLKPVGGREDSFDLDVSLYIDGAKLFLKQGAWVTVRVDKENGLVHIKFDGTGTSTKLRDYPFAGEILARATWAR